ncbi:hypothetical protein [Nocardia testacea]|uniref:hypothetical protein n=1 Tax=Nocardia testacea TaxID=248551 RepID=UPI0012F6380D|nr:hypothetical protein [Nocardia testacea]
MSAPEMVLQYINALKWPVIAALAIALLHTPARTLLAQMQRVRVAAFGAEAEVERQAQDLARDVSSTATELAHDSRREDAAAIRTTLLEPAGSPEADPFRPLVEPVSDQASAVLQLPQVEFEVLVAKLEELRDFSFGGASVLRTIESSPAHTIERIFDQLQRLVVQIRMSTDLWPGTPHDLVLTWRSIIRIAGRAISDGANASAAHNFNIGTRDWARMYADFLEDAIAEAARISARVSAESRALLSADTPR